MGCYCFVLGAISVVCIASIAVFVLPPEIDNYDLPTLISEIPHHIKTLFISAPQEPPSSRATGSGGERIITIDELKANKYKYLAILGEVFDVTSGEKHYGRDGHYNFFTGVDGSRAYSTGDFTETGLIPDVSGLSSAEIKGIEGFRDMYHKQYKYVGKLAGHYYTSDGVETEHTKAFKEMLKKADADQEATKKEQAVFPHCNSEFKASSSRVWCSNKSGGIVRDWSGVPRRLYSPDSFRCACVRTTGPPSNDLSSASHKNNGDLDNPRLRMYDNCEPLSASCPLS